VLATYTDPIVTTYSLADLDYALTVGLQAKLGKAPTLETRATALAKVRLESGNGKHCWNHDIGNVKASQSHIGNFTCIVLNEVIDGKVRWFEPQGELVAGPGSAIKGPPVSVPDGHYQTRMVSLANRVVAGHFYVDFIFGSTKYAKAMQALLAGNPAAYSWELSQAGYYTAPEPVYTKAVVSLYASSLKFLQGQAPQLEEESRESKSAWHNQLVLDGFVEGEYFALQERLNQGSGHAMREYDDN
jgi:hypothetical protein